MFPVSLSRPLVDGEVVSVSFRTVSGTATTSDYDLVGGRLTFVAGGSLRQDVAVRLNGDDVAEPPETVFLDLSDPAGVIIANGRGVGIIHDDDAERPTTATVHSPIAPVTEGDAGTTSAVFTITLDAPSESSRSIGYRTRDGSATSGSDYDGRTSSVFLAPYEDSATVIIAVRGDVLDEVDELFYLDLVSLPPGVVAANNGTAVIRDDDAAPTLYITDVRRDEGNSGVTPFIFDITLSAASGRPVSVTATTAPDSAAAGDFNAGTARLTFNPGETVKSFAVLVQGDTTFESDERFFVNLTDPDGATITDAQAVGTIGDDDAEPGPPLHVVGVFVNSTRWSPGFRSGLAAAGIGSTRFGYAIPAADQLNELPWPSLDEVSVRFDGDATVRETDLTLRGVPVPAYAISRFAYDAETDTATWTLGGAIGNDNVLIDLKSRSDTGGAGVPRLDGDWFNGLDSFPSGDGFPGGDFRFRAAVAPGDATRNGAVTAADEMEVRGRQGSARGRRADYGVFHDINGDGAINVRDTVLVRQWMSTRSPAPAAAAAWAGPASPRTRPVTRDLFSSSSLIA